MRRLFIFVVLLLSISTCKTKTSNETIEPNSQESEAEAKLYIVEIDSSSKLNLAEDSDSSVNPAAYIVPVTVSVGVLGAAAIAIASYKGIKYMRKGSSTSSGAIKSVPILTRVKNKFKTKTWTSDYAKVGAKATSSKIAQKFRAFIKGADPEYVERLNHTAARDQAFFKHSRNLVDSLNSKLAVFKNNPNATHIDLDALTKTKQIEKEFRNHPTSRIAAEFVEFYG